MIEAGLRTLGFVSRRALMVRAITSLAALVKQVDDRCGRFEILGASRQNDLPVLS
jgi:hypothetical protein